MHDFAGIPGGARDTNFQEQVRIKSSVNRSHPFRLAAVVIVFVATGCTNQKSISKDEMRSQLKVINSTASEAMLFLGQVRAHKLTSTFAAGHEHYLRETSQEVLSDLTGVSPSSGIKAVLADSHALAQELSKALADLPSSTENPSTIDNSAKQLHRIAYHAQQLETSF